MRDSGAKNAVAALVGVNKDKAKRKIKPKREDKLFTGPVVYGSTVRSSGGAKIAVVDVDEKGIRARLARV